MAFRPFPARALLRFGWLAAALVALAACNSSFPKAQAPVPPFLVAKMSQLGMKGTSPILIRIFKEESEMEIWKERADGEFGLLKTYSICKWSGDLGPKKVEGDRQAPEGFYTVTPAQMNPNSSYYLSFNIGYPNAYDRSLGRTGSNLMVHGACSSAGCYSMTDENAGEIFALARDSFRGGQRSFQVEAFPFRMTPENLAKHRNNANMDFWRMLKVGYDTFELTHKPPKVDVCGRRYVFDADAGGASFNASQACPAYSRPPQLVAALEQKQTADDAKFNQAVAALEAQARDEAARKQAAAERAAEQAANPSIITRLLGGAKPAPATGPAVPITPASVPAKAGVSVPVPKVAPAVAASTPVPPKPVAPAAPKVVAPAVAAAAPPADTGTITPDVTPGNPPVGKFVKKKFLWPGEEDNSSAAGEPAG